MEIIQSTANKTIKNLVKLHQKKYRDIENKYLIEGEHLIQEAKEAGVLKAVYSLSSYDVGVKNVLCSQEVLNKLSQQNSNAKLIGVCRKDETPTFPCDHILILNDIQDPGNLGTLLRSAYSFGFQKVILSENCVDLYNSKVIQSSQGALFHLQIQKRNIEQWIQEAKEENYTVYATALHDHSKYLNEICFQKKTALILGNEGCGLPLSLIEQCHECIKIEMAAFESLNVSIAGSICMYKAFIQQDQTE